MVVAVNKKFNYSLLLIFLFSLSKNRFCVLILLKIFIKNSLKSYIIVLLLRKILISLKGIMFFISKVLKLI